MSSSQLFLTGVDVLDSAVPLAVVPLGLLQRGVGVLALLDEVHHLAKVHKLIANDLVILLSVSLMVSVFGQFVGAQMGTFFKSVGLAMFDKGTCTTLFVTILGLISAMTPIGKLPGVSELSGLYLYTVISMLASTSTLVDLLAAPMWVVYGIAIIAVHVVLMFLLSKLFHWDLCMCSTASVACIGGTATAPIIATAYDTSYAGIGVLMGVLGGAVGNFMGLGMGALLSMFL